MPGTVNRWRDGQQEQMTLIGVPAGWARRFVDVFPRLFCLVRFVGDAFKAVAGELEALAGRR